MHYEVELPENVDDILNQDFWIFNDFSEKFLNLILGPIKFQSSVSIFVKRGSCDAEINLSKYHIEAPCIVNIRSSQIMQKHNVSPDFEASFIVMSKKLTDDIAMTVNDAHIYALPSRFPIVPISEQNARAFEGFYDQMSLISKDLENPFLYQTILHSIISFFYYCAFRCYTTLRKEDFQQQSLRLPDLFLNLVQQNFKTERFLDFYAEKLGVTTRHLSRTVKRGTGFTAGEWIERYVILEAKVLLKSTNMTIQQISDELNFPSQSFFGKYFKKNVGMSPKEFRNTP